MSPRRTHRRRRPPGQGVLLALLVLAGLLTAAACSGGGDQVRPVLPAVGEVPAEAGPADDPVEAPRPAADRDQEGFGPSVEPDEGDSLVAFGQDLYGAGCASCHGQTGDGSPRGPTLEDAGAAGADFQLRTGRMPLSDEDDQAEPGPPVYTDEQIRALVAYVAVISDGPAVPRVAAGDANAGRSTFLTNCAACHGATGVGDAMVDGHVAPPLLDTPPTQVAEAVRTGPGLMPRFPESVLTDQEVDDIVAYVGAMSEQNERGGLPLGWLGRVPEGAVAMFVGLAALVVVARLLGKRAGR